MGSPSGIDIVDNGLELDSWSTSGSMACARRPHKATGCIDHSVDPAAIFANVVLIWPAKLAHDQWNAESELVVFVEVKFKEPTELVGQNLGDLQVRLNLLYFDDASDIFLNH